MGTLIKSSINRIPTVMLLFLLCLAPHSLACAETDNVFSQRRAFMVENDLKGRDITDAAVLNAMNKVPRHLFVSERFRKRAYADYPLPIEEDQTISQPYIVAFMTQGLKLKKSDKVLEVGTGSGYQAAVLAEIVDRVYSIEINQNLAKQASALLQSLGYTTVSVKAGDGFYGWAEHAPFDAIMVTCAAEKIPPRLTKQLKEGGKIIMPLGGRLQTQKLILGTKKGKDLQIEYILPVRFVPMTGEIEK